MYGYNVFMDETLLTAEQVATKLGLHSQTIYKWAREKKIPSFKIGGSRRFKQSDIDRFVSENQDVFLTDSVHTHVSNNG
jgi:excisionase family DNA binding protein